MHLFKSYISPWYCWSRTQVFPMLSLVLFCPHQTLNQWTRDPAVFIEPTLFQENFTRRCNQSHQTWTVRRSLLWCWILWWHISWWESCCQPDHADHQGQGHHQQAGDGGAGGLEDLGVVERSHDIIDNVVEIISANIQSDWDDYRNKTVE